MAGHAPHSRWLKRTSRALVVVKFKQRIGVSDLLGELSRAPVLKPSVNQP